MARSKVYDFISATFSYPDSALVDLLGKRLLDTENSLDILEYRSSSEALQVLALTILSSSPERLEAEYVQTFGHSISRECPPYEAEYGQADLSQKMHTLSDIAGFYKAFGLGLSPKLKDRMDHVSVELDFMHFLCFKEYYALHQGHPELKLTLCKDAQTKFLGDHMGRWVFRFVERLEKKASANIYGPVGRCLKEFLESDMRTIGLEPGRVVCLDFVGLPDEEMPGTESVM
ncbi:MAG: molecular chaperone TorD family protein [Dehalococcoidia bacterium]